MNRTVKAIIGVVLIGIIMFCAISITQNMGRSLKIDVTEDNIYTLNDGTKKILDKLNQPLDIKLFYAKTASLKAPDAIRRFNEYYYFVKALLEEYDAYAGDMIRFQIVDPRPFSNEEQEALRYGLKRFQITEEESFFFGMVAKTQFGAVKSIDIFPPDRQNFVEYDISYLIDTLITREKRKLGVLSSLPIMGDDMSGYMAQMMRMQGKQPRGPWMVIRQLQQKYEVTKIEPEVDEIKDIDLLMVIHPKELPEKTLFAIDQFVMRGGRTIVCVDPHCFSDQPPPQTQMTGRTMSQNSNLNRLLAKWGVETAENTFAGDKALALTIPSPRPTERPAPLIGFLNLAPPDCYTDHVISADLNQVRMLFSGVLEKVEPVSPPEEKKDPAEDAAAPAPPAYRIQPLLQTTAAGNSFKIDNPFELNPRMMSAQSLLRHFHEGKQPVMMACLISGRLESNFPEGITVRKDASADDKPDDPGTDDEDKKEKEPEKTYKDEPLEDSDDPNMVRRTGLTAADDKTECAVAVFADVDFITDQIAYQQTFFGAAVAGDNSALLLNTIEHFSGSGDLIAIRSRGNFRRPFTRVEKIEKEAEKETADQEAQIQAEIKNYEDELKKIVDEHKSKGEMLIDAAEFNQATAALQVKLSESKQKLLGVQNKRRQKIEALENRLRNLNMLLAPLIILAIAVLLSARRAALRRRFISHASDA